MGRVCGSLATVEIPSPSIAQKDLAKSRNDEYINPDYVIECLLHISCSIQAYSFYLFLSKQQHNRSELLLLYIKPNYNHFTTFI